MLAQSREESGRIDNPTSFQTFPKVTPLAAVILGPRQPVSPRENGQETVKFLTWLGFAASIHSSSRWRRNANPESSGRRHRQQRVRMEGWRQWRLGGDTSVTNKNHQQHT